MGGGEERGEGGFQNIVVSKRNANGVGFRKKKREKKKNFPLKSKNQQRGKI